MKLKEGMSVKDKVSGRTGKVQSVGTGGLVNVLFTPHLPEPGNAHQQPEYLEADMMEILQPEATPGKKQAPPKKQVTKKEAPIKKNASKK